MPMQAPIHAGEEVSKDETVPRIIAVVVGVVILAAAIGIAAYSGLWSPPATQMQPAIQQHTTG